MTAAWWLARATALVLTGTAAVLLLLVVGVDAIERSRLVSDPSQTADLARLVAWRLPALVRELVPLWIAVGTALIVGWQVRSGAWEALQGAGVPEHRAAAVVVGVGLVLGGATALTLEALVPVSTRQAAVAEGMLRGQAAQAAGQWVRLGDRAFRVQGVDGDALVGVSAVTLHEGELVRWDASRVTWQGQAWVGQVRRLGARGGSLASTTTLPLPPPRQAQALVRPRATAEAGLWILGSIPLAGASGWWHRRAAGLLAPGIVALGALGLARRRRLGVAAGAGLSAVGAGALHLGVAVLAESVGGVGVWAAWGTAAAGGAYLTASTTYPR